MAEPLDPARLRRLAELRPDGAKVLSLFLDLDPGEFATAPARASQIGSLLDEAGRLADGAEGLSHDARVAARADVERARAELTPDGLDAAGAHGLALFLCEPAGLHETVKVAWPVATRAVLDDTAYVAPLVRSHSAPRVAVALVDRRRFRLLHGTAGALEELDPDHQPFRLPHDAETNRQRHRRQADDDVVAHLKRVSHALLALLKVRGFELVVLDTLREQRGQVEEQLHPYVRERLVPEDVDVELGSATVADVGRAVAGVLAAVHEREVVAALDRLRAGLGRGERAAGGLGAVLAALDERRVEVLLHEEGATFPGLVAPDGWLGTDPAGYPFDAGALERRDDVLEDAIQAAVLQDADVLALDREEHPDLGPHGGIAAVLRF